MVCFNAEGERAALAHTVVAIDQRPLPTEHHVNHAHDVIVERVATAVHVVELRLRHAILHVDSVEKQLAYGVHGLRNWFTSSSHLFFGVFPRLCMHSFQF